MPIKVRAAYVVLVLAVLGVITSLISVVWQDPETRVLIVIFGLAGLIFWAVFTVGGWIEDKEGMS